MVADRVDRLVDLGTRPCDGLGSGRPRGWPVWRRRFRRRRGWLWWRRSDWRRQLRRGELRRRWLFRRQRFFRPYSLVPRTVLQFQHPNAAFQSVNGCFPLDTLISINTLAISRIARLPTAPGCRDHSAISIPAVVTANAQRRDQAAGLPRRYRCSPLKVGTHAVGPPLRSASGAGHTVTRSVGKRHQPLFV